MKIVIELDKKNDDLFDNGRLNMWNLAEIIRTHTSCHLDVSNGYKSDLNLDQKKCGSIKIEQ